MTECAQYDQLGILYDLLYWDGFGGADFELYLRLAKETGGTILEMGSGTGRLCIPLAKAGVKITAMELSQEMLTIAGGKVGEELSPEQQSNLTMIQGDMTTLRLDATFGLIFFPYSSLLEAGQVENIRQAIDNAFQMLQDDGIMVLDNFYYGTGGTSRPNAVLRPAKHEKRKLSKLPDERTVCFEETDWYETKSPATERWIYADIYDNRGIAVERLTFCINRTYVLPEQMRSILEGVGFRKDKIELYGAFDQETPIDAECFTDRSSTNYHKARQVWICRK